MNRLPIMITISTLLLLGCSIPMVKTSWSKPGAHPGEYERDNEICSQDPGQTGLGHGASYDVCMQKKGWFLIEEQVN